MIQRRVLIQAASLAAASSVLPVRAQQAAKIRIGMTVSSTGSFALASQSGLRGVEVWLDEVNKRGGIDVRGRRMPVELVKLDDRSDRQMVARVYETLINDEKVDLLFAPFGSTLTAAAATVTERAGKFMAVWSAASDALYTQGFKLTVSASQMPNANIPRAGMDLAKELGLKKIALLSSDEPFPAGLAAAAKAHAQRHGIEVVLDEKYPKGTKDFTLLIQKAKAAGADLFYPTSYEQDLIGMVAQMKQINVSFPYTFMLYASTPQFAEAGPDGDFVFSHTNWHPSIRWKANAGLDRAGFEAAYKAVHPKAEFEPDFQTVLAYSAAAVTEQIVRTASGMDGAALRKAAADLSGKLVVLGGPYQIDAEGRQLGMPFPIVQRQPGRGMVSVFPADVASGKATYPIPVWSQRK